MDTRKLLAFAEVVTQMGRIERHYEFPGTSRKENDMEHSFHLAVLAWYLVDSLSLDLDLGKVLRYALAHDFVEVHAGDTYIYSEDQVHLDNKQERETAAAQRLAKDFPEFGGLHEAIEEYERRDSREARFVYALDKLTPVIAIREDKGLSWQKSGVTLEMIIQNKAPKIALSPEIEPYFKDLLALIEEEKLTADFHRAPGD